MDEVLLKDYRPRCLLNLPSHVPQTARFPVIDAHNHLFGERSAEDLISVMDAVGVKLWVNDVLLIDDWTVASGVRTNTRAE